MPIRWFKRPILWLVFTALILVALPHISRAQSTDPYIYGRVTDEGDQPLPGVSVVDLSTSKATTTNENGDYKLNFSDGHMAVIQYSFVGKRKEYREVSLRQDDIREINVVLFPENMLLEPVVKTGERAKSSTIQPLDIKIIENIPNTSGGIEALLRGRAGVVANNELSSSYSVRGGNFDENLVYVNDFEVYRPFLVRAGQQEGLSFVNPDLVSSVGFSAGGFEAKYGDKLSSVLDVKYKKPHAFKGSVALSLLMASAHVEGVDKKELTTFVFGVRHKANSYLLNALPTDGQYSPSFTDVQTFITRKLTTNWELQFLGNYSGNVYKFKPASLVSSFGTFNEAFQLNVYYDGQERDSYQAGYGGIGGVFTSDNNKLTLKFMTSGFVTTEREAYDIIGQYWISELDKNAGSQTFGEAVKLLGVGTTHNWVRNELRANIINLTHRGLYEINPRKLALSWGLTGQREKITDQLNEWGRLDSAGYTIPYTGVSIKIRDVLKTELKLESYRITGFAQNEWNIDDEGRLQVTSGVRASWWSANEDFLVSPRVQIAYKPRLAAPDSTEWTALKQRFDNLVDRDLLLRFSSGLYYQPPFYREMRNAKGQLNTQLRAQKSAHFVLGSEYSFNMLNRPFKLTAEAYYKYLWDLVPYDLDNLLIRYFGENRATGYAAGLDLRLNGEFVRGTDNWLSLSIMQTKEDLKDDFYYLYLNAGGDTIKIGITEDLIPVDSIKMDIGAVPRPTDQRVNFGIMFQDYLPSNKNFKMHLSLVVGTGFATGPKDTPKLRGIFRIPPYRRVDIGFSYLLYDKTTRASKLHERSIWRKFESIWASVEIFNVLGVNNTVSYNYFKALSPDYATERLYAVPNYLTARRINARILFKF